MNEENKFCSLPSSVSCPAGWAPGWCGWTLWRVSHGGPWLSLSAPSTSPPLHKNTKVKAQPYTRVTSGLLSLPTDKTLNKDITIAGDVDSLTAENGLHSAKRERVLMLWCSTWQLLYLKLKLVMCGVVFGRVSGSAHCTLEQIWMCSTRLAY